jgi:WD40 repeat protein
MKNAQRICFLSCFIAMVLAILPPTQVKSQSSSAILARWSSDAHNTIGFTDGSFAEIYSSDFSLIQSFMLPPVEPASQISFLVGVWSPNLLYIARIVLFDDTYTGQSPNKAVFQLLRVDSQALIFEYLGISILSGVAWNQQSTEFAFAIPTGLGSENLLIFDVAGNQITELIPPVAGGIDRITWNSDGTRIAFNTNGRLHIWDFSAKQFLASPTNQLAFSAPIQFNTVSNQVAYIEVEDYSVPELIRIWDTDTSQEVGQLIGHENAIYTFDWQGNRLVSVGLDDTLRIWDTESYQQLSIFDRGTISQVQISPDLDALLINGFDAPTFQIIDPYTGQVAVSKHIEWGD